MPELKLQRLLIDPRFRDAALKILASPEVTESNKRMARLALRLTRFQVN